MSGGLAAGTSLRSAGLIGTFRAGTPLLRMAAAAREAARHTTTQAAAHREQTWWPDALAQRAATRRP